MLWCLRGWLRVPRGSRRGRLVGNRRGRSRSGRGLQKRIKLIRHLGGEKRLHFGRFDGQKGGTEQAPAPARAVEGIAVKQVVCA